MTGSAEGTNGRSEPRGERGRFSSRRKAEAVLRLLHGEELDALAGPTTSADGSQAGRAARRVSEERRSAHHGT